MLYKNFPYFCDIFSLTAKKKLQYCLSNRYHREATLGGALLAIGMLYASSCYRSVL